MMAEAAPNGNNAEISTASAPSASSSSATSLGVLARSIMMKMGSGRALAPLVLVQGGLPCLVSVQGLSSERISERASEMLY